MNWNDTLQRIRDVAEVMADASARRQLLVSVFGLVTAVLVGAVLVFFAGLVASCGQPAFVLGGINYCYDPINVYRVLFQGAFGDIYSISLTLRQMTLLIFTAIAFAIPFRAGLLNIGAQGQFLIGALFGTVAVLAVVPLVPTGTVGGIILIPIGLVVGAVTGGAYGFIPGYLKAKFSTNEVISTLMLNFIASSITFVLVDRVWDNEAVQSITTHTIPDYAIIPPVAFPKATSFSLLSLIGVVGLLFGMYWILNNTRIGFDIDALGEQDEAALYAGIHPDTIIIGSMTVAGAVAGAGGAVYVLMVLGRWQAGFPGLGFDGIAVSILGSNHPLGIIPASFLFGILKSGSQAIDFQLGVPKQLVDVLRGLIIVFVATPALFSMFGKEMRKREWIQQLVGGDKDE